MASEAVRTPLFPVEGAGAAARYALSEGLLAAADRETCSRAALEWLTRWAGTEAGICALVDPTVSALRGLVGIEIPAERIATLDLDLGARTHPLVVALESREPVVFSDARDAGLDPVYEEEFCGRSFVAAPLTTGAAGESFGIGLLIVCGTGEAPPAAGDMAWAARALGSRLAALGHHKAHSVHLQLRQEVSRLRGITEAVTDPILLTDAEGRILVANRRAEHLLSADETVGEGRRRAVALNNMMFSASLFTDGDTAGPTRRELLLVDPVDGHDLLFELLTTPIPLDPGAGRSGARGETGLASILRDVTDLSRATSEIEKNYHRMRSLEATTRAERDRLDLILSAVHDPILVTDPAGNIVHMNPPAEELFTAEDHASDEEVERRLRTNDAVFSSVATDLHLGRSLRSRRRLNLTDPRSGEAIPMEAISAKTAPRAGEDSVVVTILHDQSEAAEKALLYDQVKRHSDELQEKIGEATRELADQNEVLRRQALELEHASAMKSQFLGNVSHELRTPLHAIVGYTSLLLEGVSGALSAPQTEKLKRVDSNANHLLSIINELLDLTRIESGRMPVQVDRFALTDLFAEVRSEAESLIDESGLEVSFDVPTDLPDLATDRQKVKQIVLNLLSNALKFTVEGSVAIRAALDDDGDRVRVAVADTGIGVAEESQATIFEAFGQSQSYYLPKQEGTGLGLSICRRLARLLGGDITLESALGEGSTFTLVLPVQMEAS